MKLLLNTRLARRLLHLCIGALPVLTSSVMPFQMASAIDTELFFEDPTQLDTAKPNILFVLDTSSSMNTVMVSGGDGFEPYDPDKTYDPVGGCASDRVYWAVGGLPSNFGDDGCSGTALANDWVVNSQFNCPAPSLATSGSVNVSEAAQLLTVPTKQGNKIVNAETWIGIDDTTVQPVNGTPSRNEAETRCLDFPGTPAADPKLQWQFVSSSAATFYSGNWLNYCLATDCLNNLIEGSRTEIVKYAVQALIEKTPGINVGLMRFGANNELPLVDPPANCSPVADPDESTGSAGTGMVVAAMQDMAVAANRQDIIDALFNDVTEPDPQGCQIQIFTPNGRTAMGATLLEAYQYFSGGKVETASQAIGSNYKFESVPESRNGDYYDNWFVQQPSGCRSNNVIIMLSDGTTEQDNSADGPIEKLPNFPDYAPGKPGLCDSRENDGLGDLDPPPPSSCVDDLAQYMHEVAPEQIRTYTVGFALGDSQNSQSAATLLQQTAERGGTQLMYTADSPDELVDVFDTIIRQVLTDAALFSSPTVAVNAFNRIQNLNELYISMFRPDVQYRWNGNVKKYRLESGFDDNCTTAVPDGQGICIVDDNGRLAVDPLTGFIRDDDPPVVRSIWSAQADGNRVVEGGAASLIDHSKRKVYSNLNGSVGISATANNLSYGEDGHLIATLAGSGSALDLRRAATLLGLPIDTPAQIPLLTPTDDYYDDADGDGILSFEENLRGWVYKLVDWRRGQNVSVAGDVTSKFMGDPLHSRPALVIYGGTEDPVTNFVTPDDAALFSVTNDGTLHAVDPETGTEYWTFVPRDQMARTFLLQQNPRAAPEDRGHGLDGSIRVLRIDNGPNGRPDGFIEPDQGDRVYLFFGQRRGGSYLYGMDVTYKDAPRLMWAIRALPDPDDPNTCPTGERCVLVGGAQTWSTPVPALVDYTNNGTSDPQRVLFVGGGYDPSIHDDIGDADNDGQPDFKQWRADTIGNRIFMLNAMTGDLLWSAGPSSSDADLTFPQSSQGIPMNNGFAADLRVIDLTGEGIADRIYAADLGGRIWRFDIFNGRNISDTGPAFIEGGVLASLGVADTDSKPAELNRRFFYAPDPSLVRIAGRTVVSVSIGSGHREFPVSDKTTRDGLFSVRDFAAFSRLNGSDYPENPAIAPDGDISDCTNCLVDVSADVMTIPANAAGWKIVFADRPRENLNAPDQPLTGNVGEKMLAETRTFDGYVYGVSNIPVASRSVCGNVGLNSLYVVSVDSAFPRPQDGSVSDPLNRVETLQQAGIAPEVVFIFPSPDDPVTCVGRDCRPAPICLVGLENCGRNFNNAPVRTFWQQRGVE